MVSAKGIYVNLPIKDLDRTVGFFTKLGFEFNPEMTDKNAACMIVGDNIFAMLLVEPFFKTFTQKNIVNSMENTEVIMTILLSSRQEVNDMVNHAIEAGGTSSNEPMDNEYMYSWSFQDLDGHLWEVMAMPASDN